MTPQSLITHWATMHDLPPPQDSQERLAIVVDGRYRIRLSPAPGGRIAAVTRIAELPANSQEREHLIVNAIRLATGRLRDDPAVVAISQEGTSLVLEDAVLASLGEQGLSDMIERMANAVSFWRKALRK